MGLKVQDSVGKTMSCGSLSEHGLEFMIQQKLLRARCLESDCPRHFSVGLLEVMDEKAEGHEPDFFPVQTQLLNTRLFYFDVLLTTKCWKLGISHPNKFGLLGKIEGPPKHLAT